MVEITSICDGGRLCGRVYICSMAVTYSVMIEEAHLSK